MHDPLNITFLFGNFLLYSWMETECIASDTPFLSTECPFSFLYHSPNFLKFKIQTNLQRSSEFGENTSDGKFVQDVKLFLGQSRFFLFFQLCTRGVASFQVCLRSRADWRRQTLMFLMLNQGHENSSKISLLRLNTFDALSVV